MDLGQVECVKVSERELEAALEWRYPDAEVSVRLRVRYSACSEN